MQTFGDWARDNGLPATDDGIDLVATGPGPNGTTIVAAIQCKFYADDYLLKKEDIDSFFTASGKVGEFSPWMQIWRNARKWVG